MHDKRLTDGRSRTTAAVSALDSSLAVAGLAATWQRRDGSRRNGHQRSRGDGIHETEEMDAESSGGMETAEAPSEVAEYVGSREYEAPWS
ncbi:hypothetical protein C8039_02610 [Halogeometricum sp. wsp3]|nr:hypothetical protein C8039_02610 [Halogeometricum sp. wsp3]